MRFNSLSYALFLPVVYLVFHFTADRYRRLVLLVASYGFYAALQAPYLPAALFATTCVAYGCGLRIAAIREKAARRRWLFLGVSACVSLLAGMKYVPSTLLLAGVSYFTFQAVSYLVDVSRGDVEAERRFGHFALYMAFFPKLLQGPIERAETLLPQLGKRYSFDYDAVRGGMLLFTWGLFQKVVVADRLALYADAVYNDVHGFSGLPLLIGTYAYALQIYFDFSGYTDMALGTGRIFGIELTGNFNRPYGAVSVADFWRRWHISFSRWIRDYLFMPLQVKLRGWGRTGTTVALAVTFLLSGMWHGARWGFVAWGLMHGLFLAAALYYRPWQKRLHGSLGLDRSRYLAGWQKFFTFHTVCLAWIFFRADGMPDAVHVVTRLFDFRANVLSIREAGLEAFLSGNVLLGQGAGAGVTMAVLLTFLLLVRRERVMAVQNERWPVRWLTYYALLAAIFALRLGDTQFLYYRF